MRTLSGCLATLALFACAPVDRPDGVPAAPDAMAPALGVSEGSMALFAKLDEKAGAEENVFFSPVSVEQAFGLLHAGAAGETRSQIEGFFGWPAGTAADEALLAQRRNLLAHGTPADIRLANALWLSREWQFGTGYVATARSYYDARVEALDFSPGRPSEDSARIINGWAAEKTDNLISEIITPQQLADATAAVLTNALYFDAGWKTELSGGPTQDFLFGDGSDRPFYFMQEQDNFVTTSEDEWRAIRLPYAGDRFAMDVVMPERRRVVATAPPAALLARLDAELTAGEPGYTDLQLPRFEVDYDSSVAQPLIALGLGLPFDPDAADLSVMTDGKPNDLYVGEAYQITKLQVYEQGTRAAAVTVLRIVPVSGLTIHRKPEKFIVDRPFTVVIRDLQTGAILFLGRIADPQPFEPETREDY
ncbi:hypothetical protein K3172_14945 [Qipengyuania sp. 6B39]|uniref:serpin family protein n=1 Tax=Qipengyuania proteolytica TaxID=2867239 RepID=UPI001C8A066F|nr:serpin family protein [Qipengyuania proteolytica]MBX7497154.1 hypothetical protein [Qipengyuania proteolytica]